MDDSSARRQFLRGVAGIGLAAGIASVGASAGTRFGPGDVKWRFPTARAVRSSPTVVGGTAYFGAKDGKLYAVDADTGEKQWDFQTGEIRYSSPNVVDGTVVFGSSDGYLYALDADSGEEQWRYETETGSYSSPTIRDGTVYVGSDDQSTEHSPANLYAIDVASGDLRWTVEVLGSVHASPSVVDGRVYFSSFGDDLQVVDAGTGTREAAFQPDDESLDSSVTVVDGVAFVGGLDHLFAVDADSGGQIWKSQASGGVNAAPTLHDGQVFAGRGRLAAWDADSGEKRWHFETADAIHAAPTVAGGTVFVPDSSGTLYAVDANTGERQWVLDRKIDFSSPVVTQGTLFVGGNQGLYAVDAGVSGSSAGSRVAQGILNHHDAWASTASANRPPSASFVTSPTDPRVGQTVTFGAGESSDDGSIRSYEWDVDGDGQFEATGEVVTHTYGRPGDYEVQLRVTDDDGAASTEVRTVTVAPAETTTTTERTTTERTTTARTTAETTERTTTGDAGGSPTDSDDSGGIPGWLLPAAGGATGALGLAVLYDRLSSDAPSNGDGE